MMFLLLFAVLRSRLVWLALGALTIATTAFWTAVVAVAAITWVADGAPSGWEPDADALAQVAMPVATVAASAALAGVGLIAYAVRRHRTRQWMPLYETMLRDATTDPATYVVQVLSDPNTEAAGYVIAVDLMTGARGPLRLPGPSYPRGTVVCFSNAQAVPQVWAWMSGKLWRRCAREAARIESRIARSEKEQHAAAEARIREAAADVVAEADPAEAGLSLTARRTSAVPEA